MLDRLGGGQGRELIEPGTRDHDVVIEQHQKFPARLLQPLIDGGGETSILSIGDHGGRYSRGILHADQIRACAIGEPVIDDDQLPGRAGVIFERDDALPGKLKLIPARNYDRR